MQVNVGSTRISHATEQLDPCCTTRGKRAHCNQDPTQQYIKKQYIPLLASFLAKKAWCCDPLISPLTAHPVEHLRSIQRDLPHSFQQLLGNPWYRLTDIPELFMCQLCNHALGLLNGSCLESCLPSGDRSYDYLHSREVAQRGRGHIAQGHRAI